MVSSIRNFCIIAHVDHGKSTLADRLLELTGSIKPGSGQQVLDRHPISRERGITIKLAPVTMTYKLDGQEYKLNLIDTPGHVDFSYEVDRTLSSVEGAVLLVDATQGVQAQTLNYWQKAKKLGLVIIPAINKIDLDSAQVEETLLEMVELFDFADADILKISAKTGLGVDKVVQAIIDKVPPPISRRQRLRAIIFDSYYDEYQGVVAGVRLLSGRLQTGKRIAFYHSQASSTVKETGYFKTVGLLPQAQLTSGEIGYLVTGLKDISQVKVGDTVYYPDQPTEPEAGFKRPSAMVFASFYPVENSQFDKLKLAMSKLSLNDSALKWHVEQSSVLGGGIRCGFLGLLHTQITRERLERDYGLNLVVTMPSVKYEYKLKHKQERVQVESAGLIPEPHLIDKIYEPVIQFDLFTQSNYYGAVLSLLMNNRGVVDGVYYFGHRVRISGKLPLAELIADFYQKLETITSGYVSFDWRMSGWQPGDLSKVELLVNGKPIEGLVFLFAKDRAVIKARSLAAKLKRLIPRQQFEVVIQARVSGKIMVKERIAPFRKDVTAKLYGGDQTRKDKLLSKQKKGKKKMKQIGKIYMPQQAFFDLYKQANQ